MEAHLKRMLPPGFEPGFAASETAALSIELQEQIESVDLLLIGSGQCEKPLSNPPNMEIRTSNFEFRMNDNFFRAFHFSRSNYLF